METKWCPQCQKHLPRSEFGNDRNRKDGVTFACLPCIRKINQAAYKKEPLKMRGRQLKRTYGVSLEEYQAMHDAQGGLCAICRQPETSKHHKGKVKDLSIDHNHKNGKVRGLLCTRCNHALGFFNEDLELLAAVAEFIKRG